MENQERFYHLQEQLATIRTYAEPLAIERDTIIVQAWQDGHSIEELTELCGYKTVNTIKARLTQAGIDWKPREQIEPEPEPAPFVWWV